MIALLRLQAADFKCMLGRKTWEHMSASSVQPWQMPQPLSSEMTFDTEKSLIKRLICTEKSVTFREKIHLNLSFPLKTKRKKKHQKNPKQKNPK